MNDTAMGTRRSPLRTWASDIAASHRAYLADQERRRRAKRERAPLSQVELRVYQGIVWAVGLLSLFAMTGKTA